MFKKSDDHRQLDAFSSPTEYFKDSTKNYYLKNDSWHNQFRKQVVMRVDETVFSVLYTRGKGAPNASLRVLVGMMILQEGQGWSDEQLFENCNFNLLVRNALGLMTLEDSVPVASTYYLFRRNLVEYVREHGEDLFKSCQAQITRDQLLEFNVSGKQVRMDSKLIGSNIAWYTRYELIHETLRLFIGEREEHIFKRSLTRDEFSLIESILDETGNKVVYRCTKAELDIRFVALGKLMYRLVKLFKAHDYGRYGTLKAVFEEQFSVGKDKIVLPLESDQISTHSTQSPHDTDCHYRDKDGNKVKGYSVNLTETCDQKQEEDDAPPVLNLITDTSVEVVSASDSSFLTGALQRTGEILSGNIEKVYADGAYNSPVNQVYCQDNEINLQLTGMQGFPSRYDLKPDGQDPDNLIITDTLTGETIPSYPSKPIKDKTLKRWRIKTEEGKYRYFDEENLRTSLIRQKLKAMPPEEARIRNNVEATIFQLGYHYPNNKSRYRTLTKQKLWAYSRSMWINFVRIMNYHTQISKRALSGLKMPQYIVKLCFNIRDIANIFSIDRIIYIPQKNLRFSAI